MLLLALQTRLQLYALPGLYYNGTLTVTHRVSDNSAYAMEDLDDGLELGSKFTKDSRCSSDDGAEKTYKYPALFHVGPRGNDEDYNPLHWSLKGFQQSSVSGYVGVLQCVVHVRSSDFFVERPFASSTTEMRPTPMTEPPHTRRSATKPRQHTGTHQLSRPKTGIPTLRMPHMPTRRLTILREGLRNEPVHYIQ